MNARNENGIKPLDIRSAGHFAEAGFCRVIGCGRTTSDRKPYCLAHIGRMRYAQKVRQELGIEAEVSPVPFAAAVAGSLKRAV